MKEVQIKTSVIEITVNDKITGGYFVNHRVTAILPGCRKVVKLSITPATKGIELRPLFGYNGSALIHPEHWRNLLLSSRVKTGVFDSVKLTADVTTYARKQALAICDCPAVTSTQHCHADYMPMYTKLAYI